MRNYKPKVGGRGRIAWLLGGAVACLLMGFLLKVGDLLSAGRERPIDSKYALVLAGQSSLMVRSDEALRLLRLARVEQLVLSSPQYSRGHFIAESVCEDYKKQGLDRKGSVLMLEHFATSTFQEAKDVIPFFVKQNVDTVLLVTNAFHASRAKYVFNSLSKGKPYFLVVAFDDPEYVDGAWTRDRGTVKMTVLESIKWVLSFWEVGSKVSWGSYHATDCILKAGSENISLDSVSIQTKIDSIDGANLEQEWVDLNDK
jgi:uncharacterized SAM-binding protein YcdF (DUF218 family)